MKPGVGGRAPPVTKEPLDTDRPPQLLPLVVQCYPNQDSSPESFRRHTCYSQTSARGEGPEGNQVCPGVASFTSWPKSQAVLLCWSQRMFQEAASAFAGYGAADCPGVETGGSTSSVWGPRGAWAWPMLGLMGSCHPSPVPGGGDPAGAGGADQRVTAVAGARAAQRHHPGVRDQVLREGLRRFPKVGGRGANRDMGSMEGLGAPWPHCPRLFWSG